MPLSKGLPILCSVLLLNAAKSMYTEHRYLFYMKSVPAYFALPNFMCSLKLKKMLFDVYL